MRNRVNSGARSSTNMVDLSNTENNQGRTVTNSKVNKTTYFS